MVTPELVRSDNTQAIGVGKPRANRLEEQRRFLCAQKASEVLNSYVTQFPAPNVPPIEAELIGARLYDLWFIVVDQDVLGSNVEGALLPDKKVVLISETCSTSGHFNFTCAHELGHWVLHNRRIRYIRQPKQQKFFEREADIFAATLLMPGPWVRQAFMDSQGNVASLAHMFNVSAPAMQLRLKELGLNGHNASR